MLNNIISAIKGPVMNLISNNQAVPEEKKSAAIETTTNALTDGLKQNMTPANLSKLAGLFSENKTSSALDAANPMLQNIESNIVSELVQKVGLSSSVSSSLAKSIVPMVVSAISGKISDPNQKGFSMDSVITALGSGSNEEDDKSGNIMSSIGKLFK